VVLVGKRGAKERHDAVAHHLVHSSLVTVNSLHHQLEDRIEQLTRLLGIAIGEELHRALEVREQDGDLLAFSFERRLGRQDLLGEVRGGIAVRRTRRCARSCGNGMSAGVAELSRG
jgi:hypothetical protein